MTTATVRPLVEPPPNLPSGGRSTIRVLLVLVASAVLLISLTGLGVAAWGVSNLRVVTDQQALPDDMRTLVVDTASVPVAIWLSLPLMVVT